MDPSESPFREIGNKQQSWDGEIRKPKAKDRKTDIAHQAMISSTKPKTTQSSEREHKVRKEKAEGSKTSEIAGATLHKEIVETKLAIAHSKLEEAELRGDQKAIQSAQREVALCEVKAAETEYIDANENLSRVAAQHLRAGGQSADREVYAAAQARCEQARQTLTKAETKVIELEYLDAYDNLSKMMARRSDPTRLEEAQARFQKAEEALKQTRKA